MIATTLGACDAATTVAPTAEQPAPPALPSGGGGHNGRVVQSSPELDTSAWTPFTSKRYGYRLAVPPRFATQPASRFWIIPETDATSIAEWDVFWLGAGDPTWSGASVPLPAGMTEAQWLAAYRQSQVDPGRPVACNFRPASLSSVTIDGRPASVRLGCGEMEALVVADGRVYSFAGWTKETTAAGVPQDFRSLFTAWLTTIELDPASALVAP